MTRSTPGRVSSHPGRDELVRIEVKGRVCQLDEETNWRSRWQLPRRRRSRSCLTGCSSSKTSTPTNTTANGHRRSSTPPNGQIFNPSTKKGGTLTFANSGDWDSLDPADTYYGYSWNFIRLYGRSLVMFKPAPGDAGTELVPDLATGLGEPSDDDKTWTYHLRSGLKFEDGTPITSKDVKYGVERSLDKTTFPNGPTYFNDFLDLQGYTGPYKDTTPGQARPQGDRDAGRHTRSSST